ncbi:MAG: sigma-70 family RNA polymerase sigma factor [Candidatus Dadabacteria bacterium]|nr:MAG: sigma-70 family RNA polymerase sigma factor [Candidatus Dadabacteria bacterium]
MQTDGSQIDPRHWLTAHGDVLYRYALKHVRDRVLAEDLVQDALLAAWKARDTFDGRSQERTWLIGILRHKILDYFRRQYRERPAADDVWFDRAADNDRFDDRGTWQRRPGSWDQDPEQAVHDAQFRQALADCVSLLPDAMATAFTLRHDDELDTDDICKALNISSTNLYVILYRARARLRDCLEEHGHGVTHA